MATYGQYECVTALSHRGDTIVFLARKVGRKERPNKVVKVLSPSVDVLGRSAADAEINRFLAAARAQQFAVGKG